MEMLYIVEKQGDRLVVVDVRPRKEAEARQLRHVTAIVAPYIAGKKNQWMVNDRYWKLLGKAEAVGEKLDPMVSLNFWGGHMNTEMGEEAVGVVITEQMGKQCAMREMGEELYWRRGGTHEVLSRSAEGSEPVRVAPYPVREEDLIFAGIAEFEGKNNVEYSYVYALGIPEEDFAYIVAADNYVDKDGKNVDVALPVHSYTLDGLKDLFEEHDPKHEVADAISRLFEDRNRPVIEKLRELGGFR